MSTPVSVRLQNKFHLDDLSPEEVDAWATALFDQIFDDPIVVDADLEASLAAGDVTISYVVTGWSFEDARAQALNVMQSAVKMLPDGAVWTHVREHHEESSLAYA